MPTDLETPYGRAIREIRTAQHLTLDEVAQAVGTDATNISRIERGLQAPSLKTLEAIAAALGVEPGQIYRQAANADGGLRDHSAQLLVLLMRHWRLTPSRVLAYNAIHGQRFWQPSPD